MYPIFDLEKIYTDIHRFLRELEEVVILTLQEYGIQSGRYPGYTGVWLDADNDEKARKICAMGIRCSRWVTMHGIALNVNNDLSFFKHIVPCGIKDKDVTSMQKELDYEVDMQEFKQRIKLNMEEVFNLNIV
jgi:lipoyl(octanoyl) transferase